MDMDISACSRDSALPITSRDSRDWGQLYFLALDQSLSLPFQNVHFDFM